MDLSLNEIYQMSKKKLKNGMESASKSFVFLYQMRTNEPKCPSSIISMNINQLTTEFEFEPRIFQGIYMRWKNLIVFIF